MSWGGIKWNIHSISLFLNFCALLKVETGCVTKKLSKENEQRWFQVLLLVSLLSRKRIGKKISQVLCSIKCHVLQENNQEATKVKLL